MFVLMHEVGHAVDDGYPDWQPFVDAINKDSCVPDEYGNTNKVEEFAQMFAMVSGGWFSGNIPADFSCLKNQFVRTLDILVNQGLMPFTGYSMERLAHSGSSGFANMHPITQALHQFVSWQCQAHRRICR